MCSFLVDSDHFHSPEGATFSQAASLLGPYKVHYLPTNYLLNVYHQIYTFCKFPCAYMGISQFINMVCFKYPLINCLIAKVLFENGIVCCIYRTKSTSELFEQYFWLYTRCQIITTIFTMGSIFMFPNWYNPYFQGYHNLDVRNTCDRYNKITIFQKYLFKTTNSPSQI